MRFRGLEKGATAHLPLLHCRVSKMYMDRSCASKRSLSDKVKIFGKEVDIDKSSDTFYPCLEEVSDDADLIEYKEGEASSLKASCSRIEAEGGKSWAG